MYKLNLVRQQPDARDHRLQLLLGSAPVLPQSVDLRADCPPVFDQGSLGSCTANAGVAARMMLNDITQMLSRLFLYYKERELEGTTATDSGATMRSVCKALQRYGVCRESLWPYIPNDFAIPPTPLAEINAMLYRIDTYATFDSASPAAELSQIRTFLATQRQPVLAGIDVYDSFETTATQRSGVIPMPDPATEQLLGGHALLFVGYDDVKRQILFRNSWGVQWGDGGYGWLPYDYILAQYAYDFWVLQAAG